MKKSLCRQDNRITDKEHILTEKLKKATEEYGMLDGGIIVALSGGADSHALLHALIPACADAGVPLACAHVNHMLRGADADADEAFCRRICADYAVPIEVLRTDVAALAKKEGRGFEETARDVRYAFFAELVEKNPQYKRIATAHTASDNAETVLFNLSRGGGIRGLCGIPPVRDNIVRPLIYVTRAEVEDYCAVNSLEYVTDCTNAETEYSRNYIRAEVIPRLDTLYGGFADAASRMSRNLRRDRDYLECEAERVFGELYSEGFESAALRALHPAITARVLMLAFERETGKRAESVHLDAVCTKLAEGGEPFSVYLPGDTVVRCERGRLCFASAAEPPMPYRVEINEGENILPDGSVLLVLPDGEEKITYPSHKVYNLSIFARLCGDTIKKGVFARSRENGDAYRTGGMTRKLKKLLNAAQYTVRDRDIIPVVCDADGILWVPGFGVRDGAGAKKDGKDYTIYYIKAENCQCGGQK